ncbi:MAG: hypothetical protein QXI33_03695 [Candidatus Pacearchaeota archaeon]
MEKKEERIRNIALSYYSRKDVLDYIYKFSKGREVVPKYYEGFGKRPDTFQYPSDILALVKKGATSFHCSEEIWSDPLKILTGASQSELNNIRKGWDVLIDIDCPWFDFSKKAAISIVKALEFKGVKNAGIKFSGSKGFHIIIPWGAFPEEIDEIKTSDMFPEWPRAIVSYLRELARPILEQMIKETESDFFKVKGFSGIKCGKCNNMAETKFEITVRCDKCSPPHIETFITSNEDYKAKKCPIHTKNELAETKKIKFYYCPRCNISSLENRNNFSEKASIDIFKVLGLDLLLVSPRHLFRMPYSLHEKTALASIVIGKNELDGFEIKHADPLNVKINEFYPNPDKDEAKTLLIQAIDFQKTNELKVQEKRLKFDNLKSKDKIKLDNIPVEKIKEDFFPPAINKILLGMQDGKKRALFILINFFRSLGYSLEDTEKRINEWNKKNDPPLRKGYIDSQLIWHSKHPPVLPPNFDNEIYKGIGVFDMDELSMKVKNPVSYVKKKAGYYEKIMSRSSNKNLKSRKTKLY